MHQIPLNDQFFPFFHSRIKKKKKSKMSADRSVAAGNVSPGKQPSSIESVSDSMASLMLAEQTCSMAGRGVGDYRNKGQVSKEFDIITTRPSNVQSKEGTSGTTVRLKANVFKIDEKSDLEFHQYRVDFEPDLELINVRKALVGKHISQFGGKKKMNGKFLC